MSKFPQELFAPPAAIPVDEFAFLGMVGYASNSLLAYFSVAPVGDDPEGFDSVTNPSNWIVDAVDPRIPRVQDPDNPFVPEGEVVPVYTPEIGIIEVDEDDPRQVHVRFNTRLEPRVRYQLTASTSIRTDACDDLSIIDPFSPTQEARSLFVGLGPSPRYITEDTLRDFDWRYFPTDPLQPPGTFRYDTTSDIGIQNEDESLRKRLMRRISSSPRAFVNLSDTYGAGLDVKTLARSGRLQELANKAAEQAREEPDVRDAGAEARLTIDADGTAVVNLAIRVVRKGRRVSRFTLPIPLSSTGN